MATFLDRRKDAAYGYLCHLEEARKWVESVIQEALPDAQWWEYSLCNGICLCKLGRKLLPDFPVWKKIYDLDQTRFQTKGLEYRHTDNINFFLLALKKIGLPKIFYPSTVDVFESKNIPQLIYCIHALSHFLKAKGSVKVTISDLYGKANFSEEAVTKISIQLEKNQKDLPAFDVVENLVEEELQYESMGLTVESSEDNTTKVGNGKANVDQDATAPAAAPTLSSPSAAPVIVVVNGDQTKPSDSKKIDLSNLFDDPSYAELQSMIEDMEKLGESFNVHLTSSTMVESTAAEAPPTSPEAITTSLEVKAFPEATDYLEATTSLEAATSAVTDDQAAASPVVEYTCKDSGVKAAVYSTVNKLKKRGSNTSSNASDAPFGEVDQAVENSDPVETVKALKTASTKNQMAYVFTDIKYANLYHDALRKEKQFSMPSSAVVIFKGINRDKCENMLEKMSPGAYILRACQDSATEFVFSYRNQTGIKHWKISPTNGKYTWGNSPAFGNIEDFVENFVRCLSSATKLHVYPGMTTSLHPEQSEVNEVKEKLDDDSNLERPLTRDQINRVVVEVNAAINSLKRSEMPSESLSASKPSGGKPWTTSFVREVSRTDAELLLEKHGRPGSFLVRPSETDPNGYAIVFRTKNEMKRWKIVHQDGQYMVHPRPQRYPSLEKIVEVFVQGLKEHTGLDMVALELPEDRVVSPLVPPVAKQPSPQPSIHLPKQPSPTVHSTSSSSQDMTSPPLSPDSTLSLYSRLNFSQAKKQDYIPDPPVNDRYSPARNEGGPSRSLSKLNPFNVTSWTVDDVTQWLVSEGLGQFVEEFGENLVDGECLINLDMAQLRDDLNVKALGHRHRLMKKINKLKEDCGLPLS